MPTNPCPAGTGSVRAIHGLDSLHRYDINTFPDECLRVCDPEGLLLFPHIHLSNNEPDPWFERGCLQWHGREWQQFLDARLQHSKRRSWIMAEADLFNAGPSFTLRNDSDTPHYNGFALVADAAHDGRTWPAEPFPGLKADARLLENPLLTIDLDRGTVALDEDIREGSVRYMLDRHPVYRDRLHACLGAQLNEQDVRLLWLARCGFSARELAQRLHQSLDDTLRIARALCEREILHPAPITQAMFDLQMHYGFPQRGQPAADHFAALWQRALPAYDNKPMLRSLDDDSEFDGGDVQQLVTALRHAFAHHRIASGDIIAVQAQPHVEYLLLVWAAWLSGITVAALDPDWPTARTEAMLASLTPRLLWLGPEQPVPPAPDDCFILRFDRLDDGESDGTLPALSAWIEAFAECDTALPDDHHADSTAAILFTSGSTGEPKGVCLSQRSLCGSGTALARHYGWCADDTLLLLASFHSMSGLRNPATAALAGQVTITVPGTLQRLVPVATLEAAQHATLLTTVPASLDRLREAREREPLMPIALRHILCTGTPLSDYSRTQAEARLGCPIANYYGLTETGGFCAGTPLHAEADHSIGPAVAAVMQIVDEEGHIVCDDREGHLRVFSQHLMQAYRLPGGELKPHAGWLETGDMAYRDDRGRVHLRGRRDDMLKNRHGERVSPLRIENALRNITGITDATVMATPAGQLLAVITAATALNEHDVLNTLQTVLGRAQSPDRLMIVDALPRNHHGKINRQQLLDMSS
ncbi:MAG TPA: class I adenylate-forming enzyme family protein [Pseudomonadales bacterium]